MWKYYKRVFGSFWKEFKSATGEQVIGALLVIGILGFQIRYRLIKPGDVHANAWSIAWPYLILIVAFFVYHLLRSPWKLHQEQEAKQSNVEKALEQERARTLALSNKLEDNKPNFEINVDGSTNWFIGAQNESILALAVGVLNKGGDSGLMGCTIHYHSSTFDGDIPFVKLGNPLTAIRGQLRYTLSNEDALFEKYEGMAIWRGTRGTGRIFTSLPGDRSKEMDQSGTIITVRIRDYLEHWFEGTYTPSGRSSDKLLGMLGERTEEIPPPKPNIDLA